MLFVWTLTFVWSTILKGSMLKQDTEILWNRCLPTLSPFYVSITVTITVFVWFIVIWYRLHLRISLSLFRQHRKFQRLFRGQLRCHEDRPRLLLGPFCFWRLELPQLRHGGAEEPLQVSVVLFYNTVTDL